MSKVFIIAEAGVNHNGSLASAKALVDVAADAGADAVKFQTFTADTIATADAEKAQYQKKSDNSESQYAMLKRLELTPDMHRELMRYCRHKNIQFLSSPFDIASVYLLHELGLELFKIPSGEIINLPYLRAIGCLKKHVILSTGMASMDEIANALTVLTSAGTLKENITVLHANTDYPTKMDDVNLKAMQTIAREFQVNVGYSDHTLGIEIPIAAVALGACVIEKHFTLDNTLPGPDHQASLEPAELRAMVTAIRHIEKALGDGFKRPSPSESANMSVVRKSIVAYTSIEKGDVFTEQNLTAKRPGHGISPLRWDDIIGTVSQKNYQKDELIQ